MFRLDGKVAIVTGGSRGIGRATAEALAKQGAHVVVNYVRGEEEAKKTVAAIEAAGGKAEAAGFDVADMKASEEAIAAIAKRLGRLDILVANAGIAIDGLVRPHGKWRIGGDEITADVSLIFDLEVQECPIRSSTGARQSIQRPRYRRRWWARR